MLLEKKLILIGEDHDYQTKLALIIEGMFLLFEPLDAQVFTNITYAVSEDMVMYMDKPGSLVMGMSNSLWNKHGMPYWQKYSFDTFIVVFDIKSALFYTKNDNADIL